MVLRSTRGTRELALEDFFVAYQKTALQADEFVELIRVPRLMENRRFRAYKISKRFDQDIAIVLAAFNIAVEDGRIGECRIAFGGMAATPKRAAACEAALKGNPWHIDSLTAAAEKLKKDFSPIDDLRGSATYRMRVAINLMRRFFAEEATQSNTSPATLAALNTL